MFRKNVVEIKDFDKEAKKRERKEKRKARANEFLAWCDNHMELLVVSAPIVLSGVVSLGKGMAKSHNLKKEQDLHDLYCYDKSLGHYWKLNRKLSNSDWVAIDQRKKNGERLADILVDLRAL